MNYVRTRKTALCVLMLLSATLPVSGRNADTPNNAVNSGAGAASVSSFPSAIPSADQSVGQGKAPAAVVSLSVSGASGVESAVSSAESAIMRADRIASKADLAARMTVPVQGVAMTFPALGEGAVPPMAGDPDLDRMIGTYATRHNLEPDLVRALIKVESNFNPLAVSPKGAHGLMQLMPETARRYGVRDIFNPEENIAGGVRYLSDLLRMFNGNTALALSAYNAGENLVAKIQKVPDYPETRDYVTRIAGMFDFKRSPYLEIP